MKNRPISIVLAALLMGPSIVQAELSALKGYGATPDQTSVSGLSSGGFMTAQLHVAYSDKFIGAGVLAGGPYYCAGSYESNSFMQNAMTTCMYPLTSWVGPDGAKLFKKAQAFAEQGLIAPVEQLKDDRLYLFGGGADKVVKAFIVKEVYDFYKAAGVPEANLQLQMNINAGHAILTNNDEDTACAITAPPYINDCDFYQSHQLLKHIYGELNPPAASDELSGQFVRFDQKAFVESDRSSMSEAAYLYVPASCETESCRIHVAFHGCKQGYKDIRDEYYKTTGYAEMADTNNMIVLFPQVESSATAPLNPQGCWDFWGYTDESAINPRFHTREAPQMKAVVAMIERLTEPKPTSE